MELTKAFPNHKRQARKERIGAGRHALFVVSETIASVLLLILMEVFLVVAIIAHLNSLPTITQIIFGGLAILGLYMIWRAVQAVSVLQAQSGNQGAVIDHIGFILISLFDGFAIVTATDLQAPGWLIAVVAVGAVALGISAINRRKKTLLLQSR
jgi:hypothetical protein